MEGKEDLDEAVRLNPNYFAAYGERGIIAAEEHDVAVAMKCTVKAVNVVRSFIRGDAAATARFENGQDLVDGEQLDLRRVAAFRAWELLLGEYRRVALAFEKGGRMTAETANNPHVQRNSALLSAKAGKLDSALASLDRSVKLGPEDPLTYKLRAAVHLVRGDRNASVRDFTRVISLAPTDRQAHELRATVYASLGEDKKATADDLEALRIGREANKKGLREVDQILEKLNKEMYEAPQ